MPQLRYTLHVYGEDEVFKETDIFPRSVDVTKMVKETIVDPMNDNRKKLGEALIELVKVEVLNPYLHSHDWHKTYVNRSTLRSIYVCTHCDITGYKPFNIVTGEMTSHVLRDEKYKRDKFEYCHDQLKEAPKKLSFL